MDYKLEDESRQVRYVAMERKPKAFIIPSWLLEAIEERPDILVALLKLSVDQRSNIVKITFDELAVTCGYANRSGVWKAICKMEDSGMLKRYSRGYIKLNLLTLV